MTVRLTRAQRAHRRLTLAQRDHRRMVKGRLAMALLTSHRGASDSVFKEALAGWLAVATPAQVRKHWRKAWGPLPASARRARKNPSRRSPAVFGAPTLVARTVRRAKEHGVALPTRGRKELGQRLQSMRGWHVDPIAMRELFLRSPFPEDYKGSVGARLARESFLRAPSLPLPNPSPAQRAAAVEDATRWAHDIVADLPASEPDSRVWTLVYGITSDAGFPLDVAVYSASLAVDLHRARHGRSPRRAQLRPGREF